MKTLKNIFIGFILGLLITGFFIYRYWPSSGDPARVTENLPENKPAVIVRGTGKLSGDIKLAPKRTPEGDNTLGQNDPLKTPLVTLYDGDKISIPVTGELKSIYYNSRTGREIGHGVHPITGETILTATGDSLRAETVFDNNYRFAVEIPDLPPKFNHVGVYWSGDSWGGYYQRDLPVYKNIGMFGRVEVDKNIRVSAGAEFKF